MAAQRFNPNFVAGSREEILGFLETKRHVTLSYRVLYSNVIAQNNLLSRVCLGAF